MKIRDFAEIRWNFNPTKHVTSQEHVKPGMNKPIVSTERRK